MLSTKGYWSYSLGIIMLLGVITTPAFAEVTHITANKELVYKNNLIEFSGTVEKESSGLVTIVIRDNMDKFVLLTQAIINHDYTFQKSIKIGDKFTEQGKYSASGFILNMTKGDSVLFDISSNSNQIIEEKIIENTKDIQEPINIINEEGTVESNQINSINRDFVDPNKDPSYYVERYYSEPTYKSWFDRNYPGQTIEETVRYTNNIQEIKSSVQEIIHNEIIPEAEASSIVKGSQSNSDNSEIAQVSLAIAGLGILFGAVYGVKRQVDNNSKQISLNREVIKKKIIRPITRTNPKEVLQMRLVKGEITLEEFESLEKKLKF